MDFQATDNWRVTGRYMKTKEDILQAYGTTWAGDGSDQLPTPTMFIHPGSNYMLSATGILEPVDVARAELGRAHNSLNYQLQPDKLFRSDGRRRAGCRCCSRMRCRPTTSPSSASDGGRTGNAGSYQTDRGPFTNDNITHDVVANLTKVWGAHAQGRRSTSSAASSRRASSPASTAEINFMDNASNPFDTGLRLRQRRDRRLQHLHAGLEVRAAGMALQEHRVVPAGQLEARQPADTRLRAAHPGDLLDDQLGRPRRRDRGLPSAAQHRLELLHLDLRRRDRPRDRRKLRVHDRMDHPL